MEANSQPNNNKGVQLVSGSFEDNQFAIAQNQVQGKTFTLQMTQKREQKPSNVVLEQGKRISMSKDVEMLAQQRGTAKSVLNIQDQIVKNSGKGLIKNIMTSDKKQQQDESKKIGEFVTQQRSSRNPKENLNVSLLSKSSVNPEQGMSNPYELEEKIKAIAFQIRKKVKKDSPKQKKTVASSTKRKDVILSPIKNHAQNNSFGITSPTGISRISPINTFKDQSRTLENDIMPTTIVKGILKKDILSKVFKQIQEKQKKSRMKLKLDPLKHRYPITSFRRAVLQEQKRGHLEEERKQKEKGIKLLRRKEIFNNSRYQRYTHILSKNHNSIQIPQTVRQSNAFSLELNNPEAQKQESFDHLEKQRQSEQKLLNYGQQQFPKEKEEKNQLEPSTACPEINEINNLIKNMMESNENYETSEKINEQQM